MSAATVGAERRRALPTTMLGLDRFEFGCLLVLVAQAFFVLAALLTKGRPLSGADGLLASDQLQYFAWIRESAHHVLIGTLRSRARRPPLLPPGLPPSGPLSTTSPASRSPPRTRVWKPIAVVITFVGSLIYVRRLLTAGGQRIAGLVPGAVRGDARLRARRLDRVGRQAAPVQFDFISGEMWSGQYLWGYLDDGDRGIHAAARAAAIERWRATRRPDAVVWSTSGASRVAWLQPWQGATLAP